MLQTAIVILNYNNYEDTINCIESVEKYNSAPVKYIVVDNGSPREGTVERLHELLSMKFAQSYARVEDSDSVPTAPLPRMTFLVSETNDGYARGNNKGLRLAKADEEVAQILLLNNDILFVEDIIPTLTNKLDTLPQAGIVSPLLLRRDQTVIDDTCARTHKSNWLLILTYLFMHRDEFGMQKRRDSQFILRGDPSLMQEPQIEIELPSGSCMLFKKELMDKIQIFDPNTFLYYEEDIIFKEEEKIGLKNYLIPSLRCIHLGASSTEKSKTAHSSVLLFYLDSAFYYLKQYGDLSFAQRMVLPVARLSMLAKIKLIRLIEKRKL